MVRGMVSHFLRSERDEQLDFYVANCMEIWATQFSPIQLSITLLLMIH